MSIGGDWAVEKAEKHPVWRTKSCSNCGRSFKYRANLFPHEELCPKCREDMNKDD